MKARSSGQIVKRGERKWLVRWYNGRGAEGKRQYAAKTVHGTKRDADAELRKALSQRDLGVVVHSKAMPLGDYLDKWLAEAAGPRLRARTVADYREVLKRHVRPVLGSKPINRITPLDLQALVNRISERGKVRMARLTHAILSGAFRQAVRWQLIPVNPCSAVDLPRLARREMRALTSEEAKRFREAIRGTRHEALFLLLLGTGLRPSEALGLQWGDFDLDAGRLAVRRTLVLRRQKGEPWRFEDTKTASSARRVPVPAPVVAALLEHRRRQSAEALRAGPRYQRLGLVFTGRTGEPVSWITVRLVYFKPAIVKAGLPATLRPYDLRHSFATLALASGVHAKTIAERLGHSSTRLTLDVYSHVTEPMQEDATRRIEAAIFGE